MATIHNPILFAEYRAEQKLSIAQEVIRVAGYPLDVIAVYIVLESMGYSNEGAREKFHCENLEELAHQIFDLCEGYLHHFMILQNQFSTTDRLSKLKEKLPENYRSIILMLPVVVQITALIIFGYSLWTYLYFSDLEATIVSIASFMSFILTGGFIQAMSREGIFYLEQDNRQNARDAVFLLYKSGFGLIVAVGAVFGIVDAFYEIFTPDLFLISMGYFILLSFLWMNLAVLISFTRYYQAVLATTIGIVPVYLIMEFTRSGIYSAHFAGLLITNVCLLLYILYRIPGASEKSKDDSSANQKAVKKVIMQRSVIFILAGTCFFLFFFIDRLVSWSVPNEFSQAYIFWFRIPYEQGMDWALLSFLITVCSLEFFINRLSFAIIQFQEKYSILHLIKHNLYFSKFYRRQLLQLFLIGLSSIVAAYFFGIGLNEFVPKEEVKEFFSQPTTTFTFFIAAGGYLFLAIALMNGLLFFTIAHPQFIIKSIVPAIGVNLVVGIYFSRTISYEFGVLGLLAGAIVYAIISTVFAKKVFANMDYYYYSGY